VVREYQALLRMDGVDLRFEDEALREVVQFSLRRKTGAPHFARPGRRNLSRGDVRGARRRGETVVIDAQTAVTRLGRLGEGAGARD